MPTSPICPNPRAAPLNLQGHVWSPSIPLGLPATRSTGKPVATSEGTISVFVFADDDQNTQGQTQLKLDYLGYAGNIKTDIKQKSLLACSGFFGPDFGLSGLAQLVKLRIAAN